MDTFFEWTIAGLLGRLMFGGGWKRKVGFAKLSIINLLLDASFVVDVCALDLLAVLTALSLSLDAAISFRITTDKSV